MHKPLLEIEDAWRMVQQSLEPNETEWISLDEAIGRTLAAGAVSDLDSPPFDKSLVDGFAIADWSEKDCVYSIVETVTAGKTPSKDLHGSLATRIMTGSPVPAGTAGVVMVEETEQVDDQTFRVTAPMFKNGQNILKRAKVVAKDHELVAAGHVVQPHDIGALAEFGHAQLRVFKKTRVSVLTTGDELVAANERPGPGQIRNSNGPMLCGLARSLGATVTDLGVGRDDRDSLNQKIATGLNGEVLIIAGGVSAGILDLIPSCLSDNGVEQVFHKINLKPGKPLWFGKAPNGCIVFGLPGNPVSSLVCFKLFAAPAICRLASSDREWIEFEQGQLSETINSRGGRRTFWPAQVQRRDGQVYVCPLNWKGSADQVTFLNAQALVDLGTESGPLSQGSPIRFTLI